MRWEVGPVKTLFFRQQIPELRLWILALLSAALIYIDTAHPHYLAAPRRLALAVSAPINQLSALPMRAARDIRTSLASHRTLVQVNANLRERILSLNSQSHLIKDLLRQNDELRKIMGAPLSKKYRRVAVAERMEFGGNFAKHVMLLNRGAQSGVAVGMTVMDGGGVVGQIVEVGKNTCRVLLISDGSHGIPVRVLRSGLHAIVEGKGDYRELEVAHITRTADIQPGDTLLSSGLGGVFPPGYPVARVTAIDRASPSEFVKTLAEPATGLRSGSFFLIVGQ